MDKCAADEFMFDREPMEMAGLVGTYRYCWYRADLNWGDPQPPRELSPAVVGVRGPPGGR